VLELLVEECSLLDEADADPEIADRGRAFSVRSDAAEPRRSEPQKLRRVLR
jgi:hypothetical protein